MTKYLTGNAKLRKTLGIEDGVPLQPRPLGKGEHNDNYVFCDPGSAKRYVLRVNVTPQPFHDDQVAYEYRALKLLEPSRCTPRALYLDDSENAPGKGALVESYCDGPELDFDHLRPGDLQCVAQLMADVHAVPARDARGETPLYEPDDPLRAFFDECVERFGFYRESGFAEERVLRWVERMLALCEPLLETESPAADRAHVVNSEALASHFLIPEASAEAAARAARERAGGVFTHEPGWFVDWERPIVGEVAQDVAYLTNPTTTVWDSEFLFPASQIGSFLDDYWRAVDGRFEPGNFEERFRAFFAVTSLHSISWCCRSVVYQQRGDEAYAGRKARTKVPLYLSQDFLDMIVEDIEAL